MALDHGAAQVVRRARGALSRWLRPALDPTTGTGLLDVGQLGTLRAFAEVLVGAAPMPDDDWEPVQRWLVGAVRTTPGYLALCAGTCRLLDALAGGPFAHANAEQRTTWVAAARLGVRPVAASELLRVGRRVEHAVRELLVPDLLRVYFDSPAGWRLVGYDEILGECRDPWAYTRRPA